MSSPDPEIFFNTQVDRSTSHEQNGTDEISFHQSDSDNRDKRVVKFRSARNERSHPDNTADTSELCLDPDRIRSDNPLQMPHTDSLHHRSHTSIANDTSHTDNNEIDLQSTLLTPDPHLRSHIDSLNLRSHTSATHDRSHTDNLQSAMQSTLLLHNTDPNLRSHDTIQHRSHTGIDCPKSDNDVTDVQILSSCRSRSNVRTSTPKDLDLLHADKNKNNYQYDRQMNAPLIDFRHNCGDSVALPNYSPAPQLPATLKLKPDTYDGSQNFEQYASHFQDCSELSGWNEHTKVLLLAASLRGPARNYYMSLPHTERRDYFLLTARLTERFGISRHQSLWLSKLENRRRSKGESIASLGDDLRQLAQKAYCDLDMRAQERLALNQFYKLISVEMKCRCIDHSCQTINDAVSVVEKYESILGSTQLANIRALDTKSSTAQSSVPDLAAALKRIEERLNKIEKSHQSHSSPVSGNNAKVCFGCNSPKHFWRQCPHNHEQQHLRQNRRDYSSFQQRSYVAPAHESPNGYYRQQPTRKPHTPARNTPSASEN